MIQRFLLLTAIGAALLSNTACNSGNGYKKVNGVEYKILKDVPGPTAKVGDVVEINLYVKADTYVLADTRKQVGKPVPALVDSASKREPYTAAYQFMSVGDSAEIRWSCDSILKSMPAEQRGQVPPWMKKGNFIVLKVSVAAIKTRAEYEKQEQAEREKAMSEMKAKEEAQKPIDDQKIQEYIAKNNIKATKTASGLYYAITKPGSGPNAKAGEEVHMKYIGKSLEGAQFDANMDADYNYVKDQQGNERKFSFVLGRNQVIKGWDEGVAMLKKGSRATLIVPSGLGYGPQPLSQEVPGYSVLVFTVEVVDIKPAPAQPSAPAPAPAQ